MDVIHGICFLAENMKKANTVAVVSYEVKYMQVFYICENAL